MFPRVLLPTDFSAHAERTFQCIAEVPGIADLLLLHVLEAGMNNENRGQHTVETRIQESLLQLEGLKKWIVRPGLAVRLLVHERVRDDVAETILAVAAQEKVDLIAVGAKGRTFRNLLLGSVSAAVLKDARTGVLLVHDRDLERGDALAKYCRSTFAKVLCPVDFSKPSLDTVEAIPSMGRIGEVVLLHVLPEEEHEEPRAIARANAEKRLGEMKDRLEETGVRARIIVSEGTPAEVILGTAEKEDASLVILTRFGKKDYVQAIGIGRTAAGVAEKARQPVLVRYPVLHYEVVTRELAPEEFAIAGEVWQKYHQQTADRKTDRIFATFVDGVPAGVARCRRHPDGLEVDGVFILPEFRNRGYARKAMAALMEAFQTETLFMHSTLELVPFYHTFGFESIPEQELPKTIRDRYSFAMGDMKTAQVQPMVRRAR
ncbi:MAG: GNAT family N-acetyltransferase [Methanomicrobiales archaeon]|nr:GNAT family N-acetyltransferase [Methanomicrobiales archaeon]